MLEILGQIIVYWFLIKIKIYFLINTYFIPLIYLKSYVIKKKLDNK